MIARVSVGLKWSGKIAPGVPKYELTAFLKNDKKRVLEKTSTSSIGGTANDEAFRKESFTVELPEGAEIQVRIVVGKRDETSPVSCRERVLSVRRSTTKKRFRKGNAPLVDGREGRKAVEVILGIYESNQSGKRVQIR